MKKFRVGFLLDNVYPSFQVNELIEFVDTNNNFDGPVIITGYRDNITETIFNKIIKIFGLRPSNFVDNIFKVMFNRIINIVELKNTKRRYPKYQANYKIKELSKFTVISIEGSWSNSNLYLEMNDKDITLIKNLNLDCIVRCGSGILRGDILEIPKLGVISFHHGDNRNNRGGPSGFWEVLNREPSSGFIIQKLNNELDGGEVLFRGNLMTNNLWLANNAQLMIKSNIYMINILQEIAQTKSLPKSEGVRLHGNMLFRTPSSLTLLKYLMSVVAPKIFHSLLSKLVKPKMIKWSIAYCYHNDFKKSLWRYKEIINPKDRFLADPFVIEHLSENFIFVEDLFYKDNKGRISVIRVNRENYDFLGVVLEEDFHLSFPFVFKDGEDIYMIPESSENFDIRLYKCIDFPFKWKLEKQLMTAVDAADTMLIKNNNRWFMLTNICGAGIGDHQSELHIFYADDFKENKWMPIESGNPVIFDPLQGRNGGLFKHNGILYRVNQIHGQDHFGKNFGINEVVTISKEKYEEKRVSIIEPNFKNSAISTHHYSANAKIAVVDFARLERVRTAQNN